MSREFNDMHPQWPDENKVACKDCRFRDKTEVFLCGKHFFPGITRDNCEKYKEEDGEYKPSKVLFQNAPCEYYERES